MKRQDILTAAPVTVSVNGAEVETVDFGSANSALVFIRSKFMKADQDGNVTVTLARPAGCGGSLLFDTVELSGSWAAGVSDSSFADWCFCDENLFFHTNTDVRKGRLSLPGGVWNRPFIPRRIYGWRKGMCSGGQPIAGKTPWLPVVLLAFDMPAEVIAQGGSLPNVNKNPALVITPMSPLQLITCITFIHVNITFNTRHATRICILPHIISSCIST